MSVHWSSLFKYYTDAFKGLGSSFKHLISCFCVNFSAFSASIYGANGFIYLKENTQFKHTEQTSQQLLKIEILGFFHVLIHGGQMQIDTSVEGSNKPHSCKTARACAPRANVHKQKHIFWIFEAVFDPHSPKKTQTRGRFKGGCQSDVFLRGGFLKRSCFMRSNKRRISHSNTRRSVTTNRNDLCSPSPVVFLLFHALSR